MEHTIDATKKSLGRLATEVATLLRGKHTAAFAPNKKPMTKVRIVNAGKIALSEKKLSDQYVTYSGYPGGLKHETRGHLLKRRGIQEVFLRTVRGMLPRNKLRAQMLKNLTIVE